MFYVGRQGALWWTTLAKPGTRSRIRMRRDVRRVRQVSVELVQTKLQFSFIGSGSTTPLQSRAGTQDESSRRKKHKAVFLSRSNRPCSGWGLLRGDYCGYHSYARHVRHLSHHRIREERQGSPGIEDDAVTIEIFAHGALRKVEKGKEILRSTNSSGPVRYGFENANQGGGEITPLAKVDPERLRQKQPNVPRLSPTVT